MTTGFSLQGNSISSLDRTLRRSATVTVLLDYKRQSKRLKPDVNIQRVLSNYEYQRIELPVSVVSVKVGGCPGKQRT